MDETTALLPKPGSPPRTPLPKLQLSVILFIQICEPLASQSIYPYINQVGGFSLWVSISAPETLTLCSSLVNLISQAATRKKWDIMRAFLVWSNIAAMSHHTPNFQRPGAQFF
jgi:hypothetical protein